MFAYTLAVDPRTVNDQLTRQQAVLFDVRPRRAYAAAHARGAWSRPLETIDTAQVSTGARTVYLICDLGVRAERAALRLRRLGAHRIAVVDGGLQAWRAAGLPVDGDAAPPA